MKDKNLYGILGVPVAATADEIRRAYRILARRYHPDVNPGSDSTARFQEISAAYETLSDPSKKARYDATLQGSTRSYAEKLRAYEEALRNMQQAQAASARKKKQSTPRTAKSSPATPPPKSSSNIFSTVSSWAKKIIPPPLWRSSSGTEIVVIQLPLTLEEAMRGAKKKVTIPASSKRGSPRVVSITIPAGAVSGDAIRVQRKSLEVICVVAAGRTKHALLEARGLTIEMPIPPALAVFGGTVIIPAPSGEVSVKVPAGSSSGTELRLKEAGIKNRAGNATDLYIRILIDLNAMSEEERASLKPLDAKEPYRPFGTQPLRSIIS